MLKIRKILHLVYNPLSRIRLQMIPPITAFHTRRRHSFAADNLTRNLNLPLGCPPIIAIHSICLREAVKSDNSTTIPTNSNENGFLKKEKNDEYLTNTETVLIRPPIC